MKNIASNAFAKCPSLSSITFYCKTIGRWFKDNTSIKEIIIGNGVVNIESQAFSGCTGITTLTIPNSVITIGKQAFEKCYNLNSLSIGNNVTNIESGAFRSCLGLTSVFLPNSVTVIENSSFEGCTALTSLTIGSGIKKIGKEAFVKCKELSDVYCYAETVPITSLDAFKDSYIDYATLHVPDASVEEYKSTSPWSEFGNIVGLSDSETAIDAKQLKALPVLIQAEDGQFSVEGAPEGTKIAVYDASGVELGAAVSRSGKTLVPARLPKGSIAIVKIGERRVKVVTK